MRTANSKIKTREQRAKLAPRSYAYFSSIAPRRLLGYIRKGDGVAGIWIAQAEIARTDTGKVTRRQQKIGVADDLAAANGTDILSYVQAFELAARCRFDGEPLIGTSRGALIEHTLMEMSRKLTAIEARLTGIEARFTRMRKPFPRVVTEVWREALARLGGASPTGSGARLLDANGEWLAGVVHFDHFNGAERNGLYDGWPVTVDENLSALRRGREGYLVQFEAWCDHLRTLALSRDHAPRAVTRRADGIAAADAGGAA